MDLDFRAMETLFSNSSPHFVVKVLDDLSGMFDIGRMQAYPLQTQKNENVERWNRNIIKGLARFMSTGDSNWYDTVSPSCLRYSVVSCIGTRMILFKSMFGIYAFQVWGRSKLYASMMNQRACPTDYRSFTGSFSILRPSQDHGPTINTT